MTELNFYPCEGKLTTSRVHRGAVPELWSLVVRDVEDLDRYIDAAEARRVAEKALKTDPGCIWSHRFLAFDAENLDVKFAHLLAAVNAGEELWSPVAEEMGPDLNIRNVPTLQTYVGALFYLGEAMEQRKDFDGAKTCYSEVLRFHPGHNIAADRLDVLYGLVPNIPEVSARRI